MAQQPPPAKTVTAPEPQAELDRLQRALVSYPGQPGDTPVTLALRVIGLLKQMVTDKDAAVAKATAELAAAKSDTDAQVAAAVASALAAVKKNATPRPWDRENVTT